LAALDRRLQYEKQREGDHEAFAKSFMRSTLWA